MKVGSKRLHLGQGPRERALPGPLAGYLPLTIQAVKHPVSRSWGFGATLAILLLTAVLVLLIVLASTLGVDRMLRRVEA